MRAARNIQSDTTNYAKSSGSNLFEVIVKSGVLPPRDASLLYLYYAEERDNLPLQKYFAVLTSPKNKHIKSSEYTPAKCMPIKIAKNDSQSPIVTG